MQVLETVLRVNVLGTQWAREFRLWDLLTSDSKTGYPILKHILHVNFNINSSVNTVLSLN